MQRFSKVVLSDEEAEIAIRAANAGQPEAWIEEAVTAELSARQNRAAAAQAAYDPATVKEFVRVTKPMAEEATGMSATYTKPKE